MRLHELLTESELYPFSDRTGLSYYDSLLDAEAGKLDVPLAYFYYEKGLKHEVVQMSPMDYISRCAKMFKIPTKELIDDRNSPQRDGSILTDKYVEDMKNGDKFPMLTLKYNLNKYANQEGLHRAIAAMKLGIPKVPVMIIREVEVSPEETRAFRQSWSLRA